MKNIRILDSSGDRVVTFDAGNEHASARREAQELFARLLGEGYSAFSVNRGEGKPDRKVTEFSQLENETIIVPRVVGG